MDMIAAYTVADGIDRIPLWCVTIPLLALAALVWDAPMPVICLAMTSEALLKLPLGLLRLRSGRWVHDITPGGGAS